MTLEHRLERMLRQWGRLARRYRIAQADCDARSEEWWLNKENAEMIERLAGEVRAELTLNELTPKPSPKPPTTVVEPVDDAVPF